MNRKLLRTIARFRRGKPNVLEIGFMLFIFLTVAYSFRPQNQSIRHEPEIKVHYYDP